MSANEDPAPPVPPAMSSTGASSAGVSSTAAAPAASSATHPLLTLVQTAERELNAFVDPALPGTVGEAASDPAIGGWVRSYVYRIIQAQTKQAEGAIYNDLKCPVCMELFCSNATYAGREMDVITIGCGHSACRGCLRGWRATGHSDCPICRTANTVSAASIEVPKSIAISNIIERLKPRRGAGAGGSRRRRSRAQRRSRSTRRK